MTGLSCNPSLACNHPQKDKRGKHHKNGAPYRNNSMAHIRARRSTVPFAPFFVSLPPPSLPTSLPPYLPASPPLSLCLSLSVCLSLSRSFFPGVLKKVACKGKREDVSDTLAVASRCLDRAPKYCLSHCQLQEVLKDVELAEAESASTTTEPEPLCSKGEIRQRCRKEFCSCVDDATCISFC